MVAPHPFESLFAILSKKYMMAISSEQSLQEPGICGNVVNDQNRRPAGWSTKKLIVAREGDDFCWPIAKMGRHGNPRL
jgi:hypothetical protein